MREIIGVILIGDNMRKQDNVLDLNTSIEEEQRLMWEGVWCWHFKIWEMVANGTLTCIPCKLNIERAYYHVLLLENSFPSKWRSCMFFYIFMSNFSFLIDGEGTCLFSISNKPVCHDGMLSPLSPWWAWVGFNLCQRCDGALEKKSGEEWVCGVWKMISLAIWWCTWKERNRWIYESKALSYQDFKR